MPETIWQQENRAVSVTIAADASGVIVDKRRGCTWQMSAVAPQEEGPIDIGHVWRRSQRSLCEEYPGRFHGAALPGGRVRYTLLGRERHVVGAFTCAYRLTDDGFAVTLADIDLLLPSLVFPPALIAESLVIPSGVGQWLRQPLAERAFWTYGTQLNMRWFGGLHGQNGWLAIIEQGWTDWGVLATGLRASPAWLTELGAWATPRTVRYAFTAGGYVGLAKYYRAYAQAHGHFRPLTEKLAEHPALANLHGGALLSFMQAETVTRDRLEDQLLAPDDPRWATLDAADRRLRIDLTHADVARIIDAVSASDDAPQVFAVMRGWLQGGYDETHPDVWPPEPALGTVDELTAIVQRQGRTTVALHDNYQDIYQQSPSWPRGVIRTRAGEPLPGGIWAGGQAYILNARDGLAYAQRNWPQIATLGPRAMFIDTTTAVQLYESYEPRNMLTRAQDAAYKRDLLRFFRDQGIILGSEEGNDLGMDLVDWIETRHRHQVGVSIPLWPLVFHDAAFAVRYVKHITQPTAPRPSWLEDLLWGYPLLWDVRSRADWEQTPDLLAATRAVAAWHYQIGVDEMLSHAYRTEDGLVETTTFTHGAITANFGAEARNIDGVTLPGYGYAITSGAT